MWLTDWNKRKSIVLTGSTSGAQTDYQVKLTVPYDSDMQADFDDLRFTRADGVTLIDAWLESKTDSVTADIWVEFPTTPADGIEQTYYMYYGNSGASSDWSIEDTFIFGDDFEGGNLDKWNKPDGTPAIVANPDGDGNVLELLDVGAKDEVNSITTLAKPFVLDYKVRVHNPGDAGTLGLSTAPWAGGNYQIIDPGYPNSGNWGYKTAAGSWTNTGHAFSIDTWYDISHVRESTSFTVYEDDVKIIDAVADTANQTLILFGSGTSDQLWIDDVRIRKYATNPATYALGSEEIKEWQIKVNDVIQTDFSVIKTLDTIAGSKKFDCIFGSSEKDNIFNHYDDIKIIGGSGNIIFRGRIEDIIPDHTNDTTLISGRDYSSELFDKYVVEHYIDKTRDWIVDDILEKNSSHITRTGIVASPIGSELTHTFKLSVWDTLVQCAKEDNYRFWVDVTNDFHYVPKGYTDSGMTLILGTDDIYSFNIENSSKEVINGVTVFGGGDPQIIITQDDLDSQSYYGIVKYKQIFDNEINTIEMATIRADAYLEENAWVLDIIEFKVDGYETLNSGELIHVTIGTHNIDSDYLVIDKMHEFPSGTTTIRVARYEKNLETIISKLVDRITNLEETTITARIAKFYDQQGYSDITTIYSRTIGSSFRLGVTGHCELGKMNLKDNTGAWIVEYLDYGAWTTPISAVASSELYSTTVAAKAIDNNNITGWYSIYNDVPGWIYFDLGSIETFYKLKMMIYTLDAPTTLDIQTSNDAISWNNIVTGYTISTGGGFTEISFTETSARYIRLYETSTNRGYSSCMEIDVLIKN